MRRTIYSFIAIGIAIISFAFTKPNKKPNLLTKLFVYTPMSYSQAQVQAPGSWSFISSPNPVCNNTPVKACQIEVSTTFVNPNNTLVSSIQILATASGSTYYVSGGSGVTSASNKP